MTTILTINHFVIFCFFLGGEPTSKSPDVDLTNCADIGAVMNHALAQ
jgi:hypothetical protein